MIRKLLTFLFIGFVLHFLVSLLFIVLPTFLTETRFSRIYKTYLLPGPFFRDDRVTTTYNLSLSWKRNGHWSEPFSHSRKYFMRYYESFDPSDLYTSRYIRSFDQVFFFEELAKGQTKQFAAFGPTIFKQHIPQDADSVRVIVTRKYVERFSVRIDTVFNSH